MQRKATKMKKTTRKELALLIKFFLEGTDYGKNEGKTPEQIKKDVARIEAIATNSASLRDVITLINAVYRNENMEQITRIVDQGVLTQIIAKFENVSNRKLNRLVNVLIATGDISAEGAKKIKKEFKASDIAKVDYTLNKADIKDGIERYKKINKKAKTMLNKAGTVAEKLAKKKKSAEKKASK